VRHADVRALVWPLFFATSVYGHVAFKIATRDATGGAPVWHVLLSAWAITATLAWIVSALLWVAILARHPLLTANTVSSLSYVLIAVAAVLFFGERPTAASALGVVLVVVGIYLVAA
jgi:drug/metabolite transporter (DMT)-like permease